MSVDVAIDELHRRVVASGPAAFLVTVGDSGAPHVVSVAVGWDADALVAPVGRTSASNTVARPQVTVLWPVAEDGYSLIADGAGTIADDGTTLRVAPTRAVLHRLADVPAEDQRPTCVRILPG